jgi:hypothetical protein
MKTWSKDELRKIAEADDLHVSPFREDGVTYGTPTWIWSVAVDDGLYVRAYNGQSSRWYKAAVRQKAGRIIAAGIRKEVIFEPVDGPGRTASQRPSSSRPSPTLPSTAGGPRRCPPSRSPRMFSRSNPDPNFRARRSTLDCVCYQQSCQ